MNYYIADLHFNCKNSYENRTIEYDNLIKENWNKVITNADDVYILGDIGRIGNNKENEYLISLISTLKGRKHLILGNHDKIKDLRLKQLFVEIVDYKELTDVLNGKSIKLVLSHYPILMWNGQHKNTILIYGHTHLTIEDQIFQNSIKILNQHFLEETKKGRTDCPQCKAINVGCMNDYMNYTPKTLAQLLS